MSRRFADIGSHPKDEDYYVILDVDFNASQEEIASAYKKLAKKFHPDKNNQDDRSRREAQYIFEKIKTAYEVLSDPRRRQIYDTLGVEGIKFDGWKMVSKRITAKEIHEEFLRLQERQMENKMMSIAKPRASFTVAIDASPLFPKSSKRTEDLDEDEYDDEDDAEIEGVLDTLSNIEVTSMSAAMSFENRLNLDHAITMSGNLGARNGIGDGSVGLNYQYRYSSACRYDFNCRFGKGPILSAGLTYQFKEGTTLSSSGFLFIFPNGIGYYSKHTLSHHIRKNLIGKLIYKEGIRPSVTTSLIYINQKLMIEVTTSFKLSQSDHRTSVEMAHSFNQNKSKVNVALVSSSRDGIAVEYGCETRVLDINILGAALSFGVASGVTLNIRYNRANQEFSFPIYLSDEIHSAPVFYGTMVPLVAFYLVDRCYFRQFKSKTQS